MTFLQVQDNIIIAENIAYISADKGGRYESSDSPLQTELAVIGITIHLVGGGQIRVLDKGALDAFKNWANRTASGIVFII